MQCCFSSSIILFTWPFSPKDADFFRTLKKSMESNSKPMAKQGAASYARELKKGHIINICCEARDKSIKFCKELSLVAYCS